MAREYKDSGIEWIGQIPKEWSTERIKTIFSERSELSDSGSEELLSVSEYYGVASRKEKIDDGEFVSRAESLVGYKKCFKGDLVSNIMLAWKGSLGVTNTDGIVSPAYCVYKPSSSIYPAYYHYLFRTSLYTSIFRLYSKGIIDSRLRLYSPYFFSIMTLIPPLSEQQKIADYLDKVCGEADEMIALQEKMIEELKAYKQSVITEAVTKGLNPNVPMKDSDIDWIGEIPEGWTVCRIKDLVETKSGSNLTTEEITNEGLYPVYGGNGIRGYYREYSNEGNFILIGRQGALCGNINYASGKFWATEHAVVCYPKREFKLRWLGELLRVMNLGQYSLSAAQPGLAVERIKVLKMPLPPINDQVSIASYLDIKCSDIDSLIAVKQQKIEELKEYKKSVIYEYVTGKKEVV